MKKNITSIAGLLIVAALAVSTAGCATDLKSLPEYKKGQEWAESLITQDGRDQAIQLAKDTYGTIDAACKAVWHGNFTEEVPSGQASDAWIAGCIQVLSE